MKTTTTKNLASAAMFVILSPFLALAMVVSVKTSGVQGNTVLVLLLTLTGAVLSGINGFGRRTARAIPPSPVKVNPVDGRSESITWSTRRSTNA
jgi:hypothetical protein